MLDSVNISANFNKDIIKTKNTMTYAILAILAAFASGVSITQSTDAYVQETSTQLAQTIYPLKLKPCTVCPNGVVCIVNDENVPMIYFYEDTEDDMSKCLAMQTDDCMNHPDKYLCPDQKRVLNCGKSCNVHTCTANFKVEGEDRLYFESEVGPDDGSVEDCNAARDQVCYTRMRA